MSLFFERRGNRIGIPAFAGITGFCLDHHGGAGGAVGGLAAMRVRRSAFVRPDRVMELKREGRSLALMLADGAEVQVGPSYVAATKAALHLD